MQIGNYARTGNKMNADRQKAKRTVRMEFLYLGYNTWTQAVKAKFYSTWKITEMEGGFRRIVGICLCRQ